MLVKEPSSKPSTWQKILFVTPLVGIIPSYLFDIALKAEAAQALSSKQFEKTIHLLIARNHHLQRSGICDLLSATLLVSLLATDRIANPRLRILSSLASIYFAISSLDKDELIDYHRRIIPAIQEGRSPILL